MSINRTIITIIVIYGIYTCYNYLVHRINLMHHGIPIQGKITHLEEYSNYLYVHISYQVNGKEYLKTCRISKTHKLLPGNVVPLRVMPSSPENPHFEFDAETLNKEVYLFLSILFGYIVIRLFVFIGSLSRPNW